MNPVSHLLTGWVVANTADLTTRDRALVTLAGVVPDIDGLGIIAEILTEQTAFPLLWYSKYHHVLCHITAPFLGYLADGASSQLMSPAYGHLCSWENLLLAWRKAACRWPRVLRSDA